MPQQPPQVLGPVLTLEALPQTTREVLARALASWMDARSRAFSPTTHPAQRADLSEVLGAREALQAALWILGPVALPGAPPSSRRSFFPSTFRPGDSLLLCHSWAIEQALSAELQNSRPGHSLAFHQETQWKR